MAIYGYARVSTAEQNLDRQLKQLREYISDGRFIVTDKASGKNFDRKGFNSLVGTELTAPLLHEGDLLIVCSLDRLGRSYSEIHKMWKHITSTLKADIRVLDVPLLNTAQGCDNLDRRFIADLVLQILSYTAQKERENTLCRQRQGIDAMPVVNGKRVSSRTGKPTGRPMIEYPEKWGQIYGEWKSGTITAVKAMRLLGLKRCSFYKLVHKYEDELET